jgi:hypothetical protein
MPAAAREPSASRMPRGRVWSHALCISLPVARRAIGPGTRRAPPARSNPKKAKDLLYLRDLMHAGADVVGASERNIAAILEHDPAAPFLVDAAANALDAVTREFSGKPAAILDQGGAMLAEREPGMSRDAATADVTGHLPDLAGILLGLRSPNPRATKTTRSKTPARTATGSLDAKEILAP